MNWFRTLLGGMLFASSAYPVGIVLYRADGKIQFADAAQLSINGKDKVLVLGDKPAAPAANAKLQSVKLGDTLLRDGRSGVVALFSNTGGTRFVYPDGLDKKTAPAPPEAWKVTRVAFKKAQSDKTPTEIPPDQFLGYLEGGVTELADVCMNSDALALIAGPNGAFAVQLELTAAAVAAYGSQPAMATIDRQVVEFMRTRLERVESGIDTAKSLDEGLRFAELSAKAFPTNPEHDKHRKLLAERKVSLDRRIAILRALAAGGQWDAYLLAYKDFEKHQQSFPELAQQQRQAFQQSRDAHHNSAKERMARGEYRRAWSEMRLAAARHPSNADLQKQLAIAWTEYSRQTAVDQRANKKQLSAGEQESLKQSLHFAERYKGQKKLDEALASVLEGEKIDPNYLPLLLTRADILGARNEIAKALATLDVYDQHAVDEERSAGSKLRNDLLFQLTDAMREAKSQVAAAWTAGRYHQTLQLAQKGLLANDKDADVLYYAGLASFATRNASAGNGLLKRYLEVSNTMDGSAERRVAVSRLLTSAPQAPPAAAPGGGTRNWFSGVPLPAGTFYCPVSLAFQPRIDKIVASNKLSIRYNWTGEQLRSIVPVFEKTDKVTGEKPAVFAYDQRVPHVVAVDSGEIARTLPAEPDDLIRASNVLLLNNPLIHPQLVERLSGKQVTAGVAGNRFFHPFVWERPYYFSFEYDSSGRVRSARQLTGAEDAGRAPVIVEFEWDNLRLTSVKAYASADGKKTTLLYERTQQYAGDKLIGELVKAGSKTSKIKYVYTESRLVSAECEKDEAIDGRSRDVLFLAAGPAVKSK